MYQMFIYWGKSTFSTSFISFKNVCKCRIWLNKYTNFLGGKRNNPPTPVAAIIIFNWATAF